MAQIGSVLVITRLLGRRDLSCVVWHHCPFWRSSSQWVLITMFNNKLPGFNSHNCSLTYYLAQWPCPVYSRRPCSLISDRSTAKCSCRTKVSWYVCCVSVHPDPNTSVWRAPQELIHSVAWMSYGFSPTWCHAILVMYMCPHIMFNRLPWHETCNLRWYLLVTECY